MVKGMLGKESLCSWSSASKDKARRIEMHGIGTCRRACFQSRGAPAMETEAEESSGKGSGYLVRGHTHLLWVGDQQHSVFCHMNA